MKTGTITLIQTPLAKKRSVLIYENSRWRLEGFLNSKNEVETFYLIETNPLEKFKQSSSFDPDQFNIVIDMIRKKY